MVDKDVLLGKIQRCDFAINDICLFLDTHKNNQAALKEYRTHIDSRKKLVDEYTLKYGPLTIFDIGDAIYWDWVDSPWPWQMEV